MNKRRINEIYYFSVSRSDYYITNNLLRDLANKTNIKVKTIITGMHYAKAFGETKKNIIKDKKISYFNIPVNYENSSFSNKDILKISSNFIKSLSNFIKIKKPKVIMLLGDRYETFLISYCATIFKIPIIHLHGGELSLAAYDDSFRHSITKMSYWHLAATENSKKRIIQLGENKKNVFNVGSLSLDNIERTKILDLDKISKKINFNLNNEIVLMTYHPTTLNPDKDLINIKNMITFLKKNDYSVVITSPNADSNGLMIKKKILKEIKGLKNFKFIENLGSQIYISIMHYASFVIGNSSSGIIESPLVRTPSIDIGDRQKSRERSLTVFNVDGSLKSLNSILKKIKKIKKNKIHITSKSFPYFNINPINKAIKIISKLNVPKNNIKNFYDKY